MAVSFKKTEKTPVEPKKKKKGTKVQMSSARTAAKTLRNIQKRKDEKGRLSDAELRRATRLVEDSKIVRTDEFARRFKELEGLSDEELIARLKPWLDKHREHQKKATHEFRKAGGRPSAQPQEVTDEKRILAYRLHQRGVGFTQIAEALGMSEGGTKFLVQEARSLLRVDPNKIDVPAEVGQTLEFYADLKQMAMGIASNSHNTPNQRSSAMAIALKAESDRTDYMKTIGVYTPQLSGVLQAIVLGSLKGQLNIGSQSEDRADMSKLVTQLARELMDADLSQLEGGRVIDVQSIADQDESLQLIANGERR